MKLRQRIFTRITSIIGSERGEALTLAAIAALIAMGFSLASLGLAPAGAVNTENNRTLVTERIDDMRSNADRLSQYADGLKDSDPARSDLFKRQAEILRQAADRVEANRDNVFQDERGGFRGGPPKTPYHYVFPARQIGEFLMEGGKPQRQRELAEALSSGPQSQSRIFKDIARARLLALYHASGPNAQFTSDGRPTDPVAWAIAMNRLRDIYKDSALARNDAFRAALDAVTEVNGGGKDGSKRPANVLVWYRNASKATAAEIFITDEEEFKKPYPPEASGGIDPDYVPTKTDMLGQKFVSFEAANRAICSKLSDVRMWPLATGLHGIYGGTAYAIGNFGCDGIPTADAFDDKSGDELAEAAAAEADPEVLKKIEDFRKERAKDRQLAIVNHPDVHIDPEDQAMLTAAGEKIKVYYKVRHHEGKTYILYVHYWSWSTLPKNRILRFLASNSGDKPHDYDYEPFIVKIDDKSGKREEILFDKGHYSVGKTAGDSAFEIDGGTHRFKPTDQPGKKLDTFVEIRDGEMDDWNRELAHIKPLARYQAWGVRGSKGRDLGLQQAYRRPWEVRAGENFHP